MLIIRLSSLGDLFHALPAVHLLKKHLGAEIDWVTQPEYEAVVRCFSEVDRVLVFHRRNRLVHLREYLRTVRREKYDYIIDMQGLLKSALAGWVARGGRFVGPSYQREGARLFYDAVAGTKNKNRHAVEEGLDVVRYLGLPVDEVCFPLDFGVPPMTVPERSVALVPCSRWPTKNWPPEHFAVLAERLLEQGAERLFLVGGSDDHAVCSEIAEKISPEKVCNACGRTTLPELGALLKRMDLVVTVDSGPMHIAAALQVPVVSLFGATEPARTGPYGDTAFTVEGENRLDCQPCFSRHCSRGDFACLWRNVTPEMVARHTERILAQKHDC
jgi:lipopolysaccharide heptosyltransferase I